MGFSLEGHPYNKFNGKYYKVFEHRGWPVLRNQKGRYCYRQEKGKRWYLHKIHTPDSTNTNSFIDSTEGPLPTGAKTWQVVQGSVFVGSSCTVTVLVRSPPHSCCLFAIGHPCYASPLTLAPIACSCSYSTPPSAGRPRRPARCNWPR